MWDQIRKHRLLQGVATQSRPVVDFIDMKDLTHYFVMTAKKDSLVRRGVLRKDTGEYLKKKRRQKSCLCYPDDRESLLHPDNVNFEALKQYALEAASFSTSHFSTPLPATPLAEWKGREDVSIFDFTHIYSSQVPPPASPNICCRMPAG